MQFRTVADLNERILASLGRLPADIDLIAGIPRSGLLAANLLALHLDKRLTDVEGLLEGRLIGVGRTRARADHRVSLAECRKVLVVDDSVNSGETLRAVKRRIARANLPHEILYATVFCTPGREGEVDFAFERLAPPRLFEWNLMHAKALEEACCDIDGVLCRDPTAEENDDGPRYLEFLQSCEPLSFPTRRIGWLVTCRLERYRGETEAWLRQHGIQYGELVMMDYPNRAARVAAGNYAGFKASVYTRTGARLFIESSRRQAVEIARRSLRPVLCIETREMVLPGIARLSGNAALRGTRWLGRRTARAASQASQWLIGQFG